jgi:hypothetical protein
MPAVLVVSGAAVSPHIATFTTAGTVSTLVRNNSALAPTWLEKPANQASVVGAPHSVAAASDSSPTTVRSNSVAPTYVAAGPVRSSRSGLAVGAPSTTQACPGSMPRCNGGKVFCSVVLTSVVDESTAGTSVVVGSPISAAA